MHRPQLLQRLAHKLSNQPRGRAYLALLNLPILNLLSVPSVSFHYGCHLTDLSELTFKHVGNTAAKPSIFGTTTTTQTNPSPFGTFGATNQQQQQQQQPVQQPSLFGGSNLFGGAQQQQQPQQGAQPSRTF